MPRGSFSRAVSRAASTGGSRSYRARRPAAWYTLLVVIVAGGIFLVGFSRNERLHPHTTATLGPTKTSDWNVALGFDICGKVEPDLATSTNIDSVGIRTFGDGLINISPAVSTTPADFEGAKATLGAFVSNYSGLTLTSSTLKLLGTGQKEWKNGDACTGPLKGKGSVVVKVWASPKATGKIYSGDPSAIHLSNNKMIMVAFVPSGATIPAPPSKSQLS